MKNILSRFTRIKSVLPNQYTSSHSGSSYHAVKTPKIKYNFSPSQSFKIQTSAYKFHTSSSPKNIYSFAKPYAETPVFYAHPLGNVLSVLSSYCRDSYEVTCLYAALVKEKEFSLKLPIKSKPITGITPPPPVTPPTPAITPPIITHKPDDISPTPIAAPITVPPPKLLKKKKKTAVIPEPPPAPPIITVNPDDILPPMPLLPVATTEPVTIPEPVTVPEPITAPKPKETKTSLLAKKQIKLSSLPKKEQEIYQLFLRTKRKFPSVEAEEAAIRDYLKNPEKLVVFHKTIANIERKINALGIRTDGKSPAELADIYIEKFGSISKQTELGSSRTYSSMALAIKYGQNPNDLSQKLTGQMELTTHLGFFQDNYTSYKSHEKFLTKSLIQTLDKDGSFIFPMSILDKSVTTDHASHAIFAVVTKNQTGNLEFHLQDTSGPVQAIHATVNGKDMKEQVKNLMYILRGSCSYNNKLLAYPKQMFETIGCDNDTKKTTDIFSNITQSNKRLTTPQNWRNCHFSGLTHAVSRLAQINNERIQKKQTPYIEQLTPHTLNRDVRRINETELAHKVLKKLRENRLPALRTDLQRLGIRRTNFHSHEIDNITKTFCETLKVPRATSLRIISDIVQEMAIIYKRSPPIPQNEVQEEIRKILKKKNSFAHSNLSPFDIYVLTRQFMRVNDNCFSECKRTYIHGGTARLLETIASACVKESGKPNTTAPTEVIWGSYAMTIDAGKKVHFSPRIGKPS